MATVIIGGGIIGFSTAYYLSQSSTVPSDIHLVESSPEWFASASGYAGGFVVSDWFSSPVASLGQLSFDLHGQLAKENDGARQWGYSRSTGTSWSEGTRGSGARGEDWLMEDRSRAEIAATHEFRQGDGPAWLRQRSGGRLDVLSEHDTTAQVNPLQLCQFLQQKCRERGVQLHQPARAKAVQLDASGTLEAVAIQEQSTTTTTTTTTTTVPCKRLVLAAGAWTARVFASLFPSGRRIPISSLAGHSLVLRSPRWKVGDETSPSGVGGCHAVFTTDETGYSPELFSRAGGEIYIAGLNDAALPLPDAATDREVDPESIAVLRRTAERLLGSVGKGGDGEHIDGLEVLREGLCWRPVTRRGTPIVSRIDDASLSGINGAGTGTEKVRTAADGGGVWVAAGHGPWGISLSLGTGKVVSEMVDGKKLSCDVSRLSF